MRNDACKEMELESLGRTHEKKNNRVAGLKKNARTHESLTDKKRGCEQIMCKRARVKNAKGCTLVKLAGAKENNNIVSRLELKKNIERDQTYAKYRESS